MEVVEKELAGKKFVNECSTAYLDTIRKFIGEHVAQRIAKVRQGRGMFDALERFKDYDDQIDLSLGADGEYCSYLVDGLLMRFSHRYGEGYRWQYVESH